MRPPQLTRNDGSWSVAALSCRAGFFLGCCAGKHASTATGVGKLVAKAKGRHDIKFSTLCMYSFRFIKISQLSLLATINQIQHHYDRGAHPPCCPHPPVLLRRRLRRVTTIRHCRRSGLLIVEAAQLPARPACLPSCLLAPRVLALLPARPACIALGRRVARSHSAR